VNRPTQDVRMRTVLTGTARARIFLSVKAVSKQEKVSSG
jgi:hypothetical protein